MTTARFSIVRWTLNELSPLSASFLEGKMCGKESDSRHGPRKPLAASLGHAFTRSLVAS